MADRLSKKKRSWNMSRIRSKDTKPEHIVRKFLYKKGFRYRLHSKSLPGKPDLSNQSKKTAVFVHGCFWHRHGCKRTTLPKTNTEFWVQKFKNNVERDKKNYKILRSLLWSIYIIWECELTESKMKTIFKDIITQDG